MHLYATYSHSLLPRALALPPLTSAGELRPPVLHAPVAWGTVALVGAEERGSAEQQGLLHVVGHSHPA